MKCFAISRLTKPIRRLVDGYYYLYTYIFVLFLGRLFVRFLYQTFTQYYKISGFGVRNMIND